MVADKAMASPPASLAAPNLYTTDFYAWTQAQVGWLRSRQWDRVDLDNLVEEIESLGRQERRELVNRLAILLGHLLKWQFQPEHQGNSWLATLQEQRLQIKLLLQENPSLKPYTEAALQTAYDLGIALATRETNLPFATFPEHCPYALEQVLNEGFLPT
jgi:Domain of unknown function DUF29